jgi:hypothetical protein
MADRIALRKIGFVFFAITTSVMLIATVVVKSHLHGRLSIEDSAPVARQPGAPAARL